MAQHDYVIENAPGLEVRADLNQVLAAILAKNSGPTEPAVKYAYQWWFDTSTSDLKIRNAANTAWVLVARLNASGWTPYRQGSLLEASGGSGAIRAAVHRTAGLTLTDGATVTVTWQTEYEDLGDWWEVSPTPTRIIVPSGVGRVIVAGRAVVTSTAAVPNSTARINPNLLKNGVALTVPTGDSQPPVFQAATSSTVTLQSTPVDVVPGDYFEMTMTISGWGQNPTFATTSHLAVWAIG